MNETQKRLIKLIYCAIENAAVPEELQHLSVSEKIAIIQYAKQQGLLPFLQNFDIFSQKECKQELLHQLMGIIYWDTRQTAEIQNLMEAFEFNGIYCIPLKGIVTKGFYPSSELRTMGDLDILYPMEQTDKLQKVMKSMGYHSDGEAAKHDHYSKDGMVVEMHKELLPVGSSAYGYFKSIWSRAVPMQGKTYCHEMTIEDHYLYTLYHLIEHFIRGGIGIRMVLDIHILSQREELDRKKVEKTLKELGVLEFEQNIRTLGEKWFSSQTSKSASSRLSAKKQDALTEYIVNGGIFGSQENDNTNSALMYQSKGRYLVHTIFPSYQVMRSVFPWLKNPLMLPIAWAKRWWNVWTKRRNNVTSQFAKAEKLKKQGKQEVRKRKQFFSDIGLGGK